MVWHKGLLFKLATCGVTAEAMEGFQSYLSDRTIAVRIEGLLSSPHVITANVPQGSHLGPILFALFINDLFVESNSELYADDLLLHNSFHKSNVQHGLLDLQQNVSTASTWASSWHGRFSPLKQNSYHLVMQQWKRASRCHLSLKRPLLRWFPSINISE